jgi:hypothetical protein
VLTYFPQHWKTDSFVVVFLMAYKASVQSKAYTAKQNKQTKTLKKVSNTKKKTQSKENKAKRSKTKQNRLICRTKATTIRDARAH